ACIVCGSTGWSALYEGLERCASCGFVRARELPTNEALARLYGPSYFHGDEYADYLGDRRVHVKNFRRRLDRITAVAGPLDSLYEIGCAYGFGLEAAKERGIRVAGIDISPEAVHHAAGTLALDARLGAFEDVALEPGAFQAFCMWDTLEHLARPEAFVAKIATLLPAGGWFFATTGDIGSSVAQRQQARWRMIHPPTHLQYFSRDTLGRFLARHGLTAVHFESTPMSRSVFGTLEGLKRFDRGLLRSAARVAQAIVPDALTRRMHFSLDLGDIMLVCARKER
ncbi:MAG TPA: class I SAM-dependent methyltransferase, partial [Planctomycetota bacterium]|nr:class I SAM-dependent methyltransferase [Planctomycetota bacterium]